MLVKMEEDMTRELNQSPSEIKEKIKEVEANIMRLKDELKWTKEQLKQLSSVK